MNGEGSLHQPHPRQLLDSIWEFAWLESSLECRLEFRRFKVVGGWFPYPLVEEVLEFIWSEGMFFNGIEPWILRRSDQYCTEYVADSQCNTHRVIEDLQVRRCFLDEFACIHMNVEHVAVHDSRIPTITPLSPRLSKIIAGLSFGEKGLVGGCVGVQARLGTLDFCLRKAMRKMLDE